jgi:hypothetical protein
LHVLDRNPEASSLIPPERLKLSKVTDKLKHVEQSMMSDMLQLVVEIGNTQPILKDTDPLRLP